MSDDELLDSEIADLLAGAGRRDADPTLTWLAAAARTTPPPQLQARVEAGVRRPRAAGRPERPSGWLATAAWALAAVFTLKATASVVEVAWFQQHVSGHAGPDRSTEAALALLAAAACAVAGGLRRSWTPVAVMCTAPLALALCLHGVGEVGTRAAGSALHMTEGVLGVLLVAAWWHDSWRRRRAGPAGARGVRA